MGRFDGARVAVTGAGGFIGGATARRLAGEGAAVLGIDADPGSAARLAEAGIETAIADITDRDALWPALAGIDLVIHTAAFVHEWGAMKDFIRVNVAGTATVIEGAAEAGADRVVHTSSVVVYGYEAAGELDEDEHPRCVGIPYIDTKSASDSLARRAGAIVVRPGDVYGPGSVPWIVRPLQLARSGRLALPGAGDGVMLPIFIDDLVEALLLAAERGDPGRAYTAWDGAPVSFGEYFGRIAELAGSSPPRLLPRPVLELAGLIGESVDRARGRPPMFTSRSATFVDRRCTVSTERIRSELGWAPEVDLEEGLRRSADWARRCGLLEG